MEIALVFDVNLCESVEFTPPTIPAPVSIVKSTCSNITRVHPGPSPGHIADSEPKRSKSTKPTVVSNEPRGPSNEEICNLNGITSDIKITLDRHEVPSCIDPHSPVTVFDLSCVDPLRALKAQTRELPSSVKYCCSSKADDEDNNSDDDAGMTRTGVTRSPDSNKDRRKLELFFSKLHWSQREKNKKVGIYKQFTTLNKLKDQLRLDFPGIPSDDPWKGHKTVQHLVRAVRRNLNCNFDVTSGKVKCAPVQRPEG